MPTIPAADFRVISIGLYDADVAMLDEKIRELRRRGFGGTGRGHHTLSRSKLIRMLIELLDVDELAPAPAAHDAASAGPLATTPAPADAPMPRLPPLSNPALARARLKLPVMTAVALSRALQSPASASLRA